MSEIICLKNVSYSYPDSKEQALQDINLSVMQGEFIALLGETGSGKSTFCRLFNGIIPHFLGGCLLGTVTVKGKDTASFSVPQLAMDVGMVLDDPDAQVFTSSVRAEAAFALENFLAPIKEIKEKIEFALGAVGLSGFEERQPVTLSGGEKQRLAIACALTIIGPPKACGKILVLDEPFMHLDPKGAAEVMAVIIEIQKKYQITIIFAASDYQNIAGYADRICILKNGRIAAIESAKTIFANPVLPQPCNLNYDSVFLKENPCGNSPNSVINICGITYLYSPFGTGIKNLDLSIQDNDFAAIVGDNGCGKTTLLKLITGLLHPQTGDIFIRGKNTKEMTVSDISKQIGFVMQNPDTQLFTDSVYKEVSFALENLGIPKKEIKEKVFKALSAAGLDDPDAFPHALGRADRVKTVIACILAMGSKILIFDEINAGLDYKESRQIMNLAKELHAGGFTIIFVTHNISLVCEYAQRLIVMDKTGITTDKKR